jgi:hypothetical protein
MPDRIGSRLRPHKPCGEIKMTPEAERLIAKVEANKPRPVWRHRLHGFSVEVVNQNLFGNVLVKMPDGNMIEMRQAAFYINYSTE